MPLAHQTWTLVLSLLAVILCKITYSAVKLSRLRRIMPPGPPGLPFLGNVFQVGSFQWLKFDEWKEQYGPIFSLNLASQPVVVLNDIETTVDLLEQRSHVYGSRPRLVMVGEILTGSMFFPIQPYGESWRRRRKAAHEGFSPRASATYQPLQETESARLAQRILRDPAGWDDHLKRSATATMLGAVYGRLSESESGRGADSNSESDKGEDTVRTDADRERDADELVARIHGFMHRVLRACLPNAYLVDVFPLMVHLPEWAARWKREGRAWFRKDTVWFEGLLGEVRSKMHAGTAEPCFALKLIENEKNCDMGTREAAWLAGTMFGAGAETTAAALSVFILAMTLYPDSMRRAQAQLDAVVGRARLPSFSDRDRLPYIEALVREVNRWRPVGPLGLARCSTQDDWYKGYFIPKGTIVLMNIWAMNRDPRFFSDYDEFRPERYLDASGNLTEPMPDTHGQGHISFGSGRRICMGRDVANQAMFMDFATLLWAFDIGQVAGEDAPSRTACIDEGIVVRPVPFKCTIRPRAPGVVSVIDSCINVRRT